VLVSVTLSDVADLAGIATGVAALALSVVLGFQAYAQHRSATRLDISAELTDVLTELSKLSGRFWLGDDAARMASWQEHGMAARYLAFRADRLLGELPSSDLNSFELGMIAQTFFLAMENDKAEEYFERAFAIAFASPRTDRSATATVRLSLLRLRADCLFILNRVDEGRSFYERALRENQSGASAGTDPSIEADVQALVGWATSELGLGHADRARDLLVRANALAASIQVPWRRARQQTFLAGVAASVVSSGPARPVGEDPPPGA
jgi:tetratricopeptide (TPR) repeat protein